MLLAEASGIAKMSSLDFAMKNANKHRIYQMAKILLKKNLRAVRVKT